MKINSKEIEDIIMQKEYPCFVTVHAISSLSLKLNIPYPDKILQAWEYEVADASRVSEFLDAYEHFEWNVEEKFALMIIIIGSCNEALAEGRSEESLIQKMKHYLVKDGHIHKKTIQYWAMVNEDNENCFAITPIIREVI